MSLVSFDDKMIIDFHTHIFPDKIAEKTISFLSQKASIPPFSDGSTDGLYTQMVEAGVDISVALPALTSPAQFDSVNRFASEVNARFDGTARRIISFAGIHPDCEDIEEKMKQIRERGFLGVKIHPDYQGTYIDDEKYIKILSCAKEHDLIVVTHAGVDGGFPGEAVRCTPARVLKLLDAVPYHKFVLAHMGGNEMHEEVFDQLAGRDVYFDTAYVLRFIGVDMFLKILARHGADRILFATDSPWSGQREDLAILKSFGLDAETEKKILCDNARKLLRI